jgi:hypothetical protein
MGGGTETVPPNDYGTNLGREEEKILISEEKTLQKKRVEKLALTEPTSL